MKPNKGNSYHIVTFDGGAYLNFYTTAKNSKAALNRLIKHSSDYKNIANSDRDITITIKKL